MDGLRPPSARAPGRPRGSRVQQERVGVGAEDVVMECAPVPAIAPAHAEGRRAARRER